MNKNKILFLLFSCLISVQSFAKSDVHVYIIVADQKLQTSTLKTWANTIYLDSKLAITDLAFYHYITGTAISDVWKNKNKSVNYLPSMINCDFNPCTFLSTFLFQKSTEKTKLFVGDGLFSCNMRELGVEMAPVKNNDESIRSKIEEEITYNKSLQKELTLIFYIPSTVSMEKPTVTFNEQDLVIKKGTSVELTPQITGASSVRWEPSTGLSCTDCLNPIATPTETTTYRLIAKNAMDCPSEQKSITITVENRCEFGFDACHITYNADDQLFRRTLSDPNNWLMASSQPGSSIYYLLCDRNCGEVFNVKLVDPSGVSVWEKEYRRTDIEAGNKLHQDHPDAFIFKLNLASVSNLDKKLFYTFEISSRDSDKNEYEKYRSPKTKFVDCGFAE